MKILQAWFLKLFLLNLVRSIAVLFALYFLLLLPDLLGNFRELSSSSGRQIIAAGNFSLLVLDSVLPMSLLVGALFTVSPMAHFNELTGARASGYSMLQLIWPAISISLFCVVFSLLLRLRGVTSGPGGLVSSLGDLEQTPAALATAYHANFAFPFLNLLAFLVGVLVASSSARKRLYGGFISAVLVFFFYHIVSSTGLALGRHGFVPPVVAGWSGNGLFSFVIVGFWLKIKP